MSSFWLTRFWIFHWYEDAKKLNLLCIFCPKLSVYKRDFDKTKCIYFLIKDEHFFNKYNEIWDKVSNIIKKIWWTYIS